MKIKYFFSSIKRLLKIVIIILIIILFIFFIKINTIIKPPENFPINQVFEIEKGVSVEEIAIFLENKNLIQSAEIFKIYHFYRNFKTNQNSYIQASHYSFNKPLNLFELHNRLEIGDSGIIDTKFTIFAGEANFRVTERLANSFERISEKKFLELIENYEGRLYPDTYFFPQYEITEEMAKNKFLKNFKNKTKELRKEVEKRGDCFNEIIIMASLIESEAGAASFEVKQKVSGVLWKRISKNMLLQVDAVFNFILQKHISRKFYSHLKIDSLYNTYKHKGLPPGPISNPSSSSIRAAINPKKTSYLFYLTGLDGIFYFSKTYAQHRIYVQRYITNLRK